MMTILKDGYVLGSCFIGNSEASIDVTLVMFDNENLNIVAETVIGPRPFIPNASGSAYFTLDKDENIIIGPPNNLQQYHIEVTEGAPAFVKPTLQQLGASFTGYDETDRADQLRVRQLYQRSKYVFW